MEASIFWANALLPLWQRTLATMNSSMMVKMKNMTETIQMSSNVTYECLGTLCLTAANMAVVVSKVVMPILTRPAIS